MAKKKRPPKKKAVPPRDPNESAFSVVQQIIWRTDDAPPSPLKKRTARRS